MNASPHPRPDDDDERGLVARARAHDRDAFVALMRRHNPRAFRVARAILPDDAEAEDAAQDGWVLAFRHLDQLDDGARFGAWLARIVAREALARARRQRLVLVDATEEDAMRDARPGPEREAQRAQARALLERAVDRLPEGFRAVFVLRELEELSVAETAACLDIPEETVKTRLHRARKLLRERLQKEIDAAASEVFGFDGERCDRMIRRVLERLPT